MPPFVSAVVAQKADLESAASAFQLFQQQIEGYLAILKAAICDDLQQIVDECCGGGAATSFLELTDTPASYAGAAGQLVAVNGGETGLEFIPVPTSSDGLHVDFDTAEQVAGRTWTGGETIYQKTVLNAGNLATGVVNIAHGISGLTQVLFIECFADRSSGTQVPFPFASGTTTFVVSVQIDTTNVILGVGTSWTGAGNVLSNVRCTIFYLK